MNHCGDCKFWGLDDESGEFRECTAIDLDPWKATDEDQDCPASGESLSPEDLEVRNSLAVVVDGSGYFAALRSKADFGCVLFKPKEPER